MWLCDSGIHYCDGTGSQFLIVVSASGTVAIAVPEAGDTRAVPWVQGNTHICVLAPDLDDPRPSLSRIGLRPGRG
jgi:hypothetical protein